jgi:hypothetical protein
VNIGYFPYCSPSFLPIKLTVMKKLLLHFLLFIAALWCLGQISLPMVIVGVGLVMALVSVLHFAVTPENY